MTRPVLERMCPFFIVNDVARSIAFYRDMLGLQVVGESENYGTEQEHLNNVFGARLRITTLRAAAGPAIEFLEYLAPRDGRPMPADARANDLMHWQTALVTDDAGAVLQATRGRACGTLSPEVVAPAEPVLGFARGLRLRDPDGHALQAVQR